MTKRKLKIVDIESELMLRIGNENTTSVPWEVLKEVGNKLEKLLFCLVELNSDQNAESARERFNFEFTGFYRGSSVPAWGFRENPQLNLVNQNQAEVKKNVGVHFSFLMNEVNRGDFRDLGSITRNPESQAKIINNVADFVNAPGEYGMSIVRRKSPKKFASIYDLRQISPAAVKLLTPHVLRQNPNIGEEVKAVAKISYTKTYSGRTKKKTISVYRDNESKLTMEYRKITYQGVVYHFNHAEFFLVQEEGKGVILENERLDLYAAGRNISEAKEDLFFQFAHSYKRFMEIDDSNLSSRLLAVKNYYKYIVNLVEPA